MESVSPVIEGNETFESVYAKDQPEYVPLPVLKTGVGVMSRWRLSDDERKHITEGGDLYICQLNGGGPLQPILPMACKQEQALQTFVECTEYYGQ